MARDWTYGDQPLQYPTSSQAGGVGKLAVGIGAVAGFGYAKFGNGKRGFDYLIAAARGIEEYSPGRILRTFQVSHMLSPFETPSQNYRYFSPGAIEDLRKSNSVWTGHLERLIGKSLHSQDILQQGFRFEGGQLRLGRTGGDTLLNFASVVRGPTGADAKFQEAYVRSLKGGPVRAGDAFRVPVSYLDAQGVRSSEAFMFTGGHTRAQAIKRNIFGYGTSLVERTNQLARAPFELPIISDILKRVPVVNRLKFDVEPSSGLKTFGKLTSKLGFGLAASALAYRHIDYWVRESSLFDGTLFEEGITVGLGTAWATSQKLLSTVAEWTGGHSFREWQEETAPGSTQLSTLIGFPAVGALGGMFYGYGSRVKRQVGYQRGGLSLAQASSAISAEDAFFKKAVYGEKVSPRLLEALDSSTVNMLEDLTESRRFSLSHKVARRVATFQQGEGLLSKASRVVGKVTPGRLSWMTGAAAGLALIAPFIPGALVPDTRPEDLDDLYSGKTDVAVRKGRWWEMGRTPFEGTRVDRYEKHWLPEMIARPKEKSIWGENAPGPLEQWWIENFTYDLEQKHYYDRPYPITGTAFEDIPLIGPLLGATVGQLIKPSKYMHVEEWQRGGGQPGAEGEDLVKRMPEKFGYHEFPSSMGGELEPGAPINPYGWKGTAGQQIYNMTEMIGLPGFTATSIKEAATGRQDFFDEEMQLESARRMYGSEREYWDQDIGGGLGTTELLRRLYPHRRRQIELYNPLRNQMPTWLPGPGERSADFLRGDPFTKVKKGESRLPGVGYAALNPDVEGVAPENYSAFHRFKILADVAPYTENYGRALNQARAARNAGRMSEEQAAQMQVILKQVAERKKRKNFSPYMYRDRDVTPMEAILARENEKIKSPDVDKSWFQSVVGGYWETLTHNAETPLEFLTPLSPAAKLIHQRTAVEDYKRFEVYGTQNAFWSHPVRDFLKPTANTVAGMFSDFIPGDVQEKRDTEKYFDILKYVKNTRLKSAALKEGRTKEAAEFENKRRETLFGVNPYTFNFSHIFRSLPRRDRDYFNEFIEADMTERKEIMKMIPKNEKALLMARWKMKDANDAQMAVKKGLVTAEEEKGIEAMLESLYKDKETEGFPKSKELWTEYIATRMSGESYPDWYRRTKLLEESLEGRGLPGPDWVGWHPAVELQDIKLKIVQNEGHNMFDYDLWPDQARNVARRPAIAEAAEELQESFGQVSESELRGQINAILAQNNVRGASVFIRPSTKNTMTFNIEQDRTEELRLLARKGIN